MSFRDWWIQRERANAPHIGRGTLLAIMSWAAGALAFTLHWAMTFSLVFVFAFSVGWEIRDYFRWKKNPALSDGFDSWDIAADMVGWALFALAIAVYQILEKALT